MTISNFQQFALSRAEIKKIVGGNDAIGRKCTGDCNVRNPAGTNTISHCTSQKIQGTKVCGCGTGSDITKNGCSWS